MIGHYSMTNRAGNFSFLDGPLLSCELDSLKTSSSWRVGHQPPSSALLCGSRDIIASSRKTHSEYVLSLSGPCLYGHDVVIRLGDRICAWFRKSRLRACAVETKLLCMRILARILSSQKRNGSTRVRTLDLEYD